MAVTLFHLLSQPSIHLRAAHGFVFRRSADGAAYVADTASGRRPIGGEAPAFDSAIDLLSAGAPLAAIRDAVLAETGPECAAQCLLWLQALARAGLIEFPLYEDGVEPATMVPQWRAFVPVLSPAPPSCDARLDRFTCLRPDADGSWLLESPLVGARLRLADPASLEHPLVRRALDASGFLDSRPPADAPATRRNALAQWEFHDLLFHAHQSAGRHHDPFGGVYPFIGEIDPLPAARESWPGPRTELPRASETPDRVSLSALLSCRRSIRAYDESRPIALGDLGALLDITCRIRASQSIPVLSPGDREAMVETVEYTRRPYPSGGGSYELEIYPVIDRCAGIEAGMYHYDAASHALVGILPAGAETRRFLDRARSATGGQAKPQVLLLIAARFGRVMWKYRSISYALILRNAGALYQSLYLAATGLGLSPCAIGASDVELFAEATGLDPVVEGPVGEFILGGRAHPSVRTGDSALE